MKNDDPAISIIDNVVSEAVQNGTLHLNAGDEFFEGPTIHINNEQLINFGSCSYLGLEQDQRLKQGVIDAVSRYGTQFSNSRAYVSAPAYSELEELLHTMFNAFPLVTATTTLGHLSAIPVLISPKDAIVLDLQVHASVQLAAKQCLLKGTPTEIIRHSQMEALESAIKTFRHNGAKKIWYLADGVYSMYGDSAPLEDIIALLNKYDNFYLYIDDAHGVSWTGKQGRGWVLGQNDIHPKMVVAVSLNKSFAASGGAILFPNQEWLRQVKTCGGTMIFSGPIQPPMLGAAIASAKLHLSPEIHKIQQELHDKILYCNKMMEYYNIPLLSTGITPIRFVGLGTLKVVCNLTKRLINEGYFANIAFFPAVSMKHGGVRVVINNLLSKENIKGMCQMIAHHLPLVLEEENYEFDFNNTFGSVIPKFQQNQNWSSTKKEPIFNITYENTIRNIPQKEWDEKLGDRGPFTWQALVFLEELFSNQPKQENNWSFHYYMIRNMQNEIVLMTFFTISLSKDDVFSPTSISQQVEALRKQKNDPYYFTSKIIIMGSFLSEGNHLYLDRSQNWQDALKLLIKQLDFLQKEHKTEMTIFRDLPANDEEMHQFMMNQEYVKLSLPDTHRYENIHHDFTGTLNSLPSDKRYFLRKNVLNQEQLFEVETLDKHSRAPNSEELKYYFQLYLQVKTRGLEINTFELPNNTFENMLKSDIWELLILYYIGSGERIPVAIGACLKSPTTYCPVVIGLDYDYVKTHGTYYQHLYQTIKRGISLNSKTIFIGMTASLQKRRFGAVPHEIVAYIQSTDTYKMEVLSHMIVQKQ